MARFEKLVMRAFPRGARQLFRRFHARECGGGSLDRGIPFSRGFSRGAFLPAVWFRPSKVRLKPDPTYR